MMKEKLNNILATTVAMPMGVDKIIFFHWLGDFIGRFFCAVTTEDNNNKYK